MKYKDFMDKQKYRKLKRDLNYKEWLMTLISKSAVDELNQIEQDSINNVSYNPINGA